MRRARIQTGAAQEPLDPHPPLSRGQAFRGDDGKMGGAPSFADVIPDGPQGRAGIQTGAAQEPLDPRLRGDDSKKGGASLFTMSSRTAYSADPGSRRAPRKSHRIPAHAYAGVGFAGMTAKRTAHPLSDVIPDSAQRRAGIQRCGRLRSSRSNPSRRRSPRRGAWRAALPARPSSARRRGACRSCRTACRIPAASRRRHRRR